MERIKEKNEGEKEETVENSEEKGSEEDGNGNTTSREGRFTYVKGCGISVIDCVLTNWEEVENAKKNGKRRYNELGPQSIRGKAKRRKRMKEKFSKYVWDGKTIR